MQAKRKLTMTKYELIAILAFTLHVTGQSIQATHFDRYNPEGDEASLAPSIRWNYDGRIDGGDSMMLPTAMAQRRNSDADLEDGLEDDDEDDRDEYKAGSSNHDRYEPAFGESNKAAQDGEEIESFFDKHLGPQDVAGEGGKDSAEASIDEMPARRNDGDGFETSASSPLVSIFHHLLSHHKRPVVITTSEEPAANDSSQQMASSSSSISSMRGGTAAYLGTTPIAYFTPMSSPSTLTAYEPHMDSGSAPDPYGDGREQVYISRQPNHYQAYSPASQSSNRHYLDQSRYPVAASYAHQQEQQSPNEDEILSFGLSFGRRPSADEEESAADEAERMNQRHLMRHSSTRAYNYNQAPLAMLNSGYSRQQPMMHHRQPMQQMRAGAKYHKDPSELYAAQPVAYNQYR